MLSRLRNTNGGRVASGMYNYIIYLKNSGEFINDLAVNPC